MIEFLGKKLKVRLAKYIVETKRRSIMPITTSKNSKNMLRMTLRYNVQKFAASG